MANDITQDPLVFDTTVTDAVCKRIVGVKVVGTGAVSIVDGSTGHPLWSHTAGADSDFEPINLFIASGLIDVTVGAATVVYIYLGSGPR